MADLGRTTKHSPPRSLVVTRFPKHPTILELLKFDGAIEQVAAIDVTIAQRNAEHPWWHQRGIRGDDGKRHRRAVISSCP